MSAVDDAGLLVLDDGAYYLLLDDAECDASSAFGFMYKRSAQQRNPCDDPCVGHFMRNRDGSWQARISVIYDEVSNSDTELVGDFDNRLHALSALWQARKQAVC